MDSPDDVTTAAQAQGIICLSAAFEATSKYTHSIYS
jgi:hypothetical protein